MLQNIVVAGAPRSTSAFGLHINQITTIKVPRVSKALMITEQYFPDVGVSLIPTFYPGGFRVPNDEADFWQKIPGEKPKYKMMAEDTRPPQTQAPEMRTRP